MTIFQPCKYCINIYKSNRRCSTYVGIEKSGITTLLSKQLEHLLTNCNKIRSGDNELIYNFAIDIFFSETNNLDFASLNLFIQSNLIDLIDGNSSSSKFSEFGWGDNGNM